MSDGFIAFDDHWFGRYSNRMITLMKAVTIAIVANKRCIFFPLTPMFLRVIDINAMSRVLDVNGPECMIEWAGSNITKRIQISQSLNDKDYEYALQLAPEHWGSGCLVRPLHHLPILFPPANVTLGTYGSIIDYFAKSGYKEGVSISNSTNGIVSNREVRDTLMRSVNGILTTPRALLYYVIPLDSNGKQVLHPLAPSTFIIHKLAEELYQSMNASAIICVHLRLGDYEKKHGIKYFDYFEPHISAFLNKSNSRKLHLITDAKIEVVNAILKRFPSTALECNHQKECSTEGKDDMFKVAILQQTCASADAFLGSDSSTFTTLIARMRTDMGLHAGFYVDQGNHKLRPCRVL